MKTKRKSKQEMVIPRIIVAVLIIVALFMGVFGAIVHTEIARLTASVNADKQTLSDSVNKSVQSYLQTKYIAAGNEANSSVGELLASTLSDEEMAELLASIDQIIANNLTDEVYAGTKELVIDDLRDEINQSIEAILRDKNLNLETVTAEVEALVLEAIMNALQQSMQNIQENSSNISNLSNSIANVTNRLSTLESSINNVTKGYEGEIEILRKADEELAKKIEAILATVSTTEELNAALAEINNLIKQQSDQIAINYNTTNETINNVNNDLTTNISETNENLQSTKTDLENRIGNVSSELDALSDNLNESNRTNESQITSLRETDLELIRQIEDIIAKASTKEELDAAFVYISQIIEEQGETIEQNNITLTNEINTARSDLTTNINNVENNLNVAKQEITENLDELTRITSDADQELRDSINGLVGNVNTYITEMEQIVNALNANIPKYKLTTDSNNKSTLEVTVPRQIEVPGLNQTEVSASSSTGNGSSGG